jgi:hypothetical protein
LFDINGNNKNHEAASSVPSDLLTHPKELQVTAGLEYCIVDVLWKWNVETPKIAPAVSLLERTVK